MTSYRITAQATDGPVHEVRVEAAALAAAFRAAAAWAREQAEPSLPPLEVFYSEEIGWTWKCNTCGHQGPSLVNDTAAYEDGARYHRYCQEG